MSHNSWCLCGQESFESSFHEVFDSDYTKKYLFFPVKSRFTFNGSDAGRSEELQQTCDRIARDDLELARLSPGFASPSHKGFVAAQYVIGKSSFDKSVPPTGSDWHCAVGNNYFIQVFVLLPITFLRQTNGTLWVGRG